MSRYRLATSSLAALLLAAPSFADGVANPGYLSVPGTDTKLKVYGTVQVYGEYFANQNEFVTGSMLDGYSHYFSANATGPDQQFSMTAHTSRFGFATITPSGSMGDVTTKIEMDFYHGFGTTTSNATLRIRHLVIGLGNWTVGYTWSNWVDLDAGAETVDFAGPIGQAGFDTPRTTQVRYTLPIGKASSLAFSLEENQNDEGFYTGSVTADSPAGTVPDVKYPTVIAAYTYTGGWGHVGVRGMEQYWGAFAPGTPGGAGSVSASSWAPAVQLSGAYTITAKDSLVGSVYTGKGLGAYGTDNGYDIAFDTSSKNSGVDFTKSTGWQLGYTHNWNDDWRTNVVLSGITYSSDPFYDALTTAAAQAASTDVKSSQNFFLNTIVKVAKNVELGMEYGYESATSFGSNAVLAKDLSTSNKATASKFQVCLTATY